MGSSRTDSASRAPRRFTLAAVGVAIACCAVVLAGCVGIPLGSGEETASPVPSKDHPAPSASATNTAVMVGWPQKAGSWQITVLKAKKTKRAPGGAKAPAGKAFLLVDTEFRNTKIAESLQVNPKDASLRNAAGKKFSLVGTAPSTNARDMRPIGPGYGGRTTFVYQVPGGVGTYTFTYAAPVGKKRVKLQWSVP